MMLHSDGATSSHEDRTETRGIDVAHGGSTLALAAASCAVSIVAFLALPYLQFGLRLTAPQMIELATRFGQPQWQVLWILPVTTGVVGTLCALLATRGRRRGPARAWMLNLCGVLATLTALGHGLTIAALSEGPTGEFGLDALDFLGSGYWIALLGVATAAVVVGVELARSRP